MGLQDKVKELGQRVKDRQVELDQERTAKQRREAVGKDVREAPPTQRMDFFCFVCCKDMTAVGSKQAHTNGMGTYNAQCPLGHNVVRYITNKWKDPYWNASLKVRKDRELYADAMLTPADPRFKIVYPAQWKALMEHK